MERNLKNQEILWLVFFYRMGTKPVKARMKIWRKLNKAGAILFKGAVYILPFSEDNFEFFTWLVKDVSSLGGEASFIKVSKFEDVEKQEVIAIFNSQRELEYEPIGKLMQNIERNIASMKKGGNIKNVKQLQVQLGKCKKQIVEIKGIDFFSSRKGTILFQKIQHMEKDLSSLNPSGQKSIKFRIEIRSREQFQKKRWLTRPRPFVDRMASAWLIKKFIDKEASFVFGEEFKKEKDNLISFDMVNADFSHIGDLCTFEVLCKSFGLKDRGLKKIQEIVHDLDIKDGKYTPKEAPGLESILSGIRNQRLGDLDSLTKGVEIFEILYKELN